MIVAIQLPVIRKEQEQAICAHVEEACKWLPNIALVPYGQNPASILGEGIVRVPVSLIFAIKDCDQTMWRAEARNLLSKADNGRLLIIAEPSVLQASHDFARGWQDSTDNLVEVLSDDSALAIHLSSYAATVIAKAPTPILPRCTLQSRPEGRAAEALTRAINEFPRIVSEQIANIAQGVVRREMMDVAEDLRSVCKMADFLAMFFSEPLAEPLHSRTSLREDATLLDICKILAAHKRESVHVLDVGCGHGNVPEALLHGLDAKSLKAVHYTGIDVVSGYVASLRRKYSDRVTIAELAGEMRTYNAFGSFHVETADALALPFQLRKSFDLVICHNVVHEISPCDVPKLIGGLNSALADLTSGYCVIMDMESLSEEFPESRAFPWTAEEFEGLLAAMGFNLQVGRHVKQVKVFSAFLHGQESVELESGCAHALRVVIERLKCRLRDYRELVDQKQKDQPEICKIIQILSEIVYMVESLRLGGALIDWGTTTG